MSDAIFFVDDDLDGALIVPKARVNHHGWVEIHDETGSITALVPPQRVDEVQVNVEVE